MARYERIEGTAQRFWEIEIDGRHVTTRWGRLGRHPQSRTIECRDETTAQQRRDTLVRQKLAKGYERVGTERGAERTGQGNPELEAAIAQDPDDLDARLVYADWLMSQDATLGELIALEVQHARTDDDGLLSRIARLRDQCAGEVAERRTLRLRWRLGLIRSARLSVIGTGSSLLERLFALPAARTLTSIQLETHPTKNPAPDRIAMLRTLGRLAAPHLTSVALKHQGQEDDATFGDAGAWWTDLPAFDTLLLSTRSASLPLPTDRLRVFGFDAPAGPWDTSLTQPWPNLEHLVLARTSVPFATHLLTSLVAPELHTLALHHLDLESIPWRHILRGPVGARLRTIELLGLVPWTLRGVMDRLGDRLQVRWCGGRAPPADARPEGAPWLQMVVNPQYSVPW
ncbi:MAG: WGR domain-containing protein [Myxococcota bacterium]